MVDTDRQYVRRRPGLSWHIVRTHTRMFDGWRTLCGRSIVMDDASALDSLPGAKSCESCLRIFTRGVDPASDEAAAIAAGVLDRGNPADYIDLPRPEGDGSTAPVDAPDVPS